MKTYYVRFVEYARGGGWPEFWGEYTCEYDDLREIAIDWVHNNYVKESDDYDEDEDEDDYEDDELDIEEYGSENFTELRWDTGSENYGLEILEKGTVATNTEPVDQYGFEKLEASYKYYENQFDEELNMRNAKRKIGKDLEGITDL